MKTKLFARAVAGAAMAGCLVGCDSARQMEHEAGAQAVMLPVAEHGEPLTQKVVHSRHVFLELSVADAAGAMYSVPTVTVHGTSFPLYEGKGERYGDDALRRKLKGLHDDNSSRDLRCYIKADARCKFKDFSDLVDRCTATGLWRLSVVARDGAAMPADGRPQLLAFAFLRPCPCRSEEEANEPCLIELCEDDLYECEDNDESEYALARRLQIEIGPSADGDDDGVVVWCRKGVSLAKLDSAFRAMADNPAVGGTGVCLKCCGNAPYKTFVNVLDVLYKHGFKRVYVFTL